ncbi:hypothetical protein M885DRAFT_615919 [Pelagophyceae sp. CCMP2097]|nr:hypothetical protein M885DRAFT_615919 [Pelagophyceae sp. CCMP2097]
MSTDAPAAAVPVAAAAVPRAAVKKRVVKLKPRKRKAGDEERLVHSSTRHLLRALKKAKAFEVTKCGRRCKEAKEKDGADADAKTARKAQAALESAKNVDCDACVKLSLRRAGIAFVGAAGADLAAIETCAAARKVLGHKLVREVQSTIDARSTDVRKGKLMKSDPVFRAAELARGREEAKMAKKAGKSKRPSLKATTTAAFVDSLNGMAQETVLEGDGFDDDGEPIEAAEEKPKNRMGQRQRRALQEAANAKKQKRSRDPAAAAGDGPAKRAARPPPGGAGGGSAYGPSTRAPRPKPKPEMPAPSAKRARAKKTEAVTSATSGLHASWAAKKLREEKEKKVEFKGTKVTF